MVLIRRDLIGRTRWFAMYVPTIINEVTCTTIVSTFSRFTISQTATASNILSTSRTNTTSTSTAASTPKWATPGNKGRMITTRCIIGESRALNTRERLWETWTFFFTQYLCPDSFKLWWRTKKVFNNINVSSLLFHSLQVKRERLMHISFLTHSQWFIIILNKARGAFLKPKILFASLINSSNIPSSRVYMFKMLPNLLSSRHVERWRPNMRLNTTDHKSNNCVILLIPSIVENRIGLYRVTFWWFDRRLV